QSAQPNSPNHSISRQHAKIEFINDGFYIFDTGSTNGTLINRKHKSRIQLKVEPLAKEGVLLCDRDIIQLGLALLSFEVVSDEARIKSLIDQLSAQSEHNFTPGSTADIYRTGSVSTSLTNALSW
ncbi:MAG: FHA domain-containing protein, partial [Acidobacteriota bacterium]